MKEWHGRTKLSCELGLVPRSSREYDDGMTRVLINASKVRSLWSLEALQKHETNGTHQQISASEY
eukprot:scaffold294143_cov39-Attheya_sp.AAC.1